MDIRMFLVFSTLIGTTAMPSAPPSPDSCSDELVLFSPCLPYVSTFPNNMTDSPPPQCCDEIASAFNSGSAVCLCYLVKRPRILGFPVNSTRVLSLASVCPIENREAKASNFSLESLCSGKPRLPPLKSITGPGSSIPHISGQDNSTPPQMSPPKESGTRSFGLPHADDPSIGPPVDSSIGPPADASIGPPADASIGPPADSSIGPSDDSYIGPSEDSYIGPSVDSSVGPGVDESPTITVTPIRSASATGKMYIIFLHISLGIPIFLLHKVI